MKNISLHVLLNSVGISPPSGFINPKIKNISFNSKDVEKGTLFLGLKGTKVDGGIYWKDAINNGAEAAVISKEAQKSFGEIDYRKVLVLDGPLDYIFGQMISEFWNRPSRELKIIGVTGTNGKTTITFLLEHLLKNLGKEVALFGTLYNRWPDFSEHSAHTTDFADKLQPKLNAARKANAEFVIMEVSSHSLAQNRISGCEFIAAIFTNLSQDHLDYHIDMESYFQTKMKLFKYPFLSSNDSFSVVNIDNEWGIRLINQVQSSCLAVSANKDKNFFNKHNYFYISNKELTNRGSYCLLHTPCEVIQLFVPLVGEFNLMNALQGIITLYNLGFPLKDICNSMKSFKGVPGRMERVEIIENDKKNLLPNVIIDYAHTPDGLKNVLDSIKNFAEGKIITVFGCGGDRDSKKRPIMGSIAEKFSDQIFLTSDNPRTENPNKIINDILNGIQNRNKIIVDINRYSAIQKAINLGKSDDIILIAGKGHENYQILKNETIDFDDKKVANSLLIEKLNLLI
tara:strand:- start:11262 stop:12800 length:1539 start_codon:yes stop_codon:yes gene_type:complete